jgi:membrane peptidoglycan carboxypeptidase
VLQRGGGLAIYTTLDLALQERAEQLLYEDGLTKLNGQWKGEAALVATDPASGAVRVLVGGRDYATSSYNRAVLAKRSPGSAFKPVVYLAALDSGMVSPATELIDEEVVFETPGLEDYKPQNYSRRYRGKVTLRDSLADSLNVPTVKLCDMVRGVCACERGVWFEAELYCAERETAHGWLQVGLPTVIAMARRLGIRSHLPNSLSLALGACEVTPLEIAAAYNTIAARGLFSRPHLVRAPCPTALGGCWFRRFAHIRPYRSWLSGDATAGASHQLSV